MLKLEQVSTTKVLPTHQKSLMQNQLSLA